MRLKTYHMSKHCTEFGNIHQQDFTWLEGYHSADGTFSSLVLTFVRKIVEMQRSLYKAIHQELHVCDWPFWTTPHRVTTS